MIPKFARTTETADTIADGIAVRLPVPEALEDMRFTVDDIVLVRDEDIRQAMRLVLSGLFDAHPGVKIILGHLGETIPYTLARIDEALSRDTPMKNFREVFNSHFYVTTSGFFSDAALQCCIHELGADRIMFSVDWPFASNSAGVNWIKTTPLDSAVRQKIMSGNARQLLRM